jgi:hypothetical protein
MANLRSDNCCKRATASLEASDSECNSDAAAVGTFPLQHRSKLQVVADSVHTFLSTDTQSF